MKNIVLAFFLFVYLLPSCNKPEDPIVTPPVVEDTIASVWQKNVCARIIGFFDQKLVVYEDSYIRTYDQLNGQILGQYYYPGLSYHYYPQNYGEPNEFYLYQNKLSFLKMGEQTLNILNLDDMTIVKTLDASTPMDTVGIIPFTLSAKLSGVGKFLFYNAGEDFHFVKYDLEEGTQTGLYVISLGPQEHTLDPSVKGAWIEPNGDLIVVGWKPNQSGDFPISVIYNETQKQVIAYTPLFFPIKNPILGHTGGVFFGDFDDLKAYSKTTAERVWGTYNFADYKVGDEKIIVLKHNQSSIQALNASDGVVLWESVLQPTSATTYWHFTDLQNGILTMNSYNDLICFDTNSGKETFRLKGRQNGDAYINGDYLFVSSQDNCRLACYKFK